MGVNGASAQYAGGACSSGQPDNCSNPIQYAPHGPISSMLMGNGVSETWSFNNRLQPLQIQAGSLLTLGFGYTAGQNNGNLASQAITRGPQSWTQNYVYDALNRLGGPSNTQGALQENGATLQNYGYDQNGNWYLAYYDSSRISAPTIETPQSTSWFLANNQINGWAFDAAGNETGIPASGGSTTRAACATNTMPGVAMLRTSCFDAENRMISETDVFGVTTTYAYDGDGHRVNKNVNGAATTFVYDASGNLVAEYGGQNADTGTLYVSVDHLGSTRLLADSSGAQKYCYDYLPFGGDLFAGTDGRPSCYPSAASSGIRFTGKERDAETGLDYFGARYFSAAQGRFTTPDPLMASAHASDPQSWNRYAYARNNPLRYIDPDGLEVPPDCAKDNKCTIVVKINVIYDKNANNGKGLTPEQKKKFEQGQLDKAKKDYATSNIALDVNYTAGGLTTGSDGRPTISGTREDYLNVLVTDHGDSESKANRDTGVAAIFLNINDAHNGSLWPIWTSTLSHELGHQFLGDPFKDFDPWVYMLYREPLVDAKVAEQQLGTSQPRFRDGLEPRRYAVPANPEAVKPKQ
jgi:RHS repeat-associated protein